MTGTSPRASSKAGTAATTIVVAAVFGVLLGRFVFAGGDTAPLPPAVAPPAASAAALVADLQARVRASPADPALLTRLGSAYLDQARETADPSWYTRAAEALDRSLTLDPARPDTLVGLGLLSLARHDFEAALGWAGQAGTMIPDSAEPLGVAFDALVELGRYDEAEVALQAMVDRRPSLASLVRVSQLRELHGDRAGAVEAMTQAVLAGSRNAGDLAFAETLAGDLHLGGGDLDRAAAAYERALRHRSGYGPAEVGHARVAAARGDLDGATSRLAGVVVVTPRPEWVALLGDWHLAAGRPADAAAQYELVRAIDDLNRAAGVTVDLEAARFEADQAGGAGGGAGGERAVALARAALEARPTIWADDTLAWALHRTGRSAEALPHARAALRLGTADALLWYHLAAVEAAVGLVDDARTHLDQALRLNPFLTVRDLPEARDLGSRLGLVVR